MRLRNKILSSSVTTFVPVRGRVEHLRDIKWKNTEVIYVVTSGGQGLCIEADIDKTWEENAVDYQIGAIRLFRHNDGTKKNKLLQMTTIDIERYVTTEKKRKYMLI